MRRPRETLPPPFSQLPVSEDGTAAIPAPVVKRFRSIVYGHFRLRGRSFPWRETRNPYRILVSELMLQQTQTERVATKYPAFIRTFPTLASLAGAGTGELLLAWQGLGYNRRALALRESARIILDQHRGIVPRVPDVLATLPGIGKATASEIAAFAYDVPSALIETNIRRVYLYFFFAGRDAVRDREILPLVDRTLDRSRPRLWYYAVMDYGVMMKKLLPAMSAPDPNRRSAHYARQPRFEGSDRQVRGRILRVLAEEGGMTERALLARVRAVRDAAGPRYGHQGDIPLELGRLRAVVARLRDEGFLTRVGGAIRLP